MTSSPSKKTTLKRCAWAGDDPLYQAYHDDEWGVPKADDQALFEKLILEGFQAGLSWITILRKRENFRKAFDNFDAEKMVRYTPKRLEKLMGNEGIIRNRLKIEASVQNARVYLDLMEEKGFAAFLWDFVDGKPIQNRVKAMSDIPGKTDASVAMSKALKARGFKFCGPTITYAFMQSIGMVNDHVTSCHRHKPCQALAKSFRAPEK